MGKMTLDQIPPLGVFIEYEVRSSWWVKHCSWPFFQELAARYCAAKVNRKYKAMITSLVQRDLLSQVVPPQAVSPLRPVTVSQADSGRRFSTRQTEGTLRFRATTQKAVDGEVVTSD